MSALLAALPPSTRPLGLRSSTGAAAVHDALRSVLPLLRTPFLALHPATARLVVALPHGDVVSHDVEQLSAQAAVQVDLGQADARPPQVDLDTHVQPSKAVVEVVGPDRPRNIVVGEVGPAPRWHHRLTLLARDPVVHEHPRRPQHLGHLPPSRFPGGRHRPRHARREGDLAVLAQERGHFDGVLEINRQEVAQHDLVAERLRGPVAPRPQLITVEPDVDLTDQRRGYRHAWPKRGTKVWHAVRCIRWVSRGTLHVVNVPADTHGTERLLYNVPDACQVTGLSRAHLYVEMNAGRLGYVHVGRRRLIPRDAIESYVECLKAGSTGPEAA